MPTGLRRPQIGFLGVTPQLNLKEVGQPAAADGRPDEVRPGPGVLVYVEIELADEDVEWRWDFAREGDRGAESLSIELRF